MGVTWVAQVDVANSTPGRQGEAFFLLTVGAFFCLQLLEEGEKTHDPQDEIQHSDFTKGPRPLYYKTPPCVFYHKNVCSKAIFGP